MQKEEENYYQEHCCPEIDCELLSNVNVTIFHYNAKYREYGIKIPKSTGCMLMIYCLFCGKKMPSSLRDEWFNILENEYELDDPMDRDSKRVPQEFLTDEWWKKHNYGSDVINKSMNKGKWLEKIEQKIQKERENYQGPHCCLTMHHRLLNSLTILHYNMKSHEYSIKTSSKYIPLHYCIFCGKKSCRKF